jgi:hypothetical protein
VVPQKQDEKPPPCPDATHASLADQNTTLTAEDPLVRLIFNTSANERTNFITHRAVLSQSTLYRKLLGRVEDIRNQMPSIQDPSHYDDITIMQATEHLTRNSISSISSSEGSPSLFQQLQDKLGLYDFSIAAGIPDLESKVVQQLAGCAELSLGFFVAFASVCYDTSRGHKITRTSSVGQFLKLRLKHYLPAIMRSKKVSSAIKQKGGDLAAELEAVLEEHWAEVEEQTRDRGFV